MNIRRLEERFRRDPAAIRLGNLAANLARISSSTPSREEWPFVLHNIRESKYFIEWMAPDLRSEFWEFVIALQVRLAQVEQNGLQAWVDRTSDDLRVRIREWSEALTQIVLAMRTDPEYVPTFFPEVLVAQTLPPLESA
jgi:hypothetical protein